MSDSAKILLNEVELGIETEAFLNGPIGRYLVDQLERNATEAGEKLKEVDAGNAIEIIRLQHSCAFENTIKGILAGLIQQGWQAEDELKQKEM